MNSSDIFFFLAAWGSGVILALGRMLFYGNEHRADPKTTCKKKSK